MHSPKMTAREATPATRGGSGAQARRFIYSFLVSALAGCLLLGGFNYVVNPLNYYPPRLVAPLAWGDQLVKVDLMKKAPPSEVLILGSSRTMKLSPSVIQEISGMTAFNGGVSSSRPEEWYAMLRYGLDTLEWPVKEVVLGIDPETLFYNGEPNEDLLSSPELRRYLPRQLYLNSMVERAKLLLSWDQTQLSIRAVRKAAEPAAPPELIYEDDGYLRYVGWERAVADGTFTLVTQYQVSNYEQRYAGAAGLNPMRRKLFEDLLQLCQERGIRVRAFLTPFHPSVLTAMEQLPTYQHVEAEVTQYAAELEAQYLNLTVDNFTDVSAFSGDADNFFDGVHYRAENARLILTQLYAQ